MAGRGVTALAVVTGLTGLGIAFVHYGQKVERENLHKGVIRDAELLRLKKMQMQDAQNNDKN